MSATAWALAAVAAFAALLCALQLLSSSDPLESRPVATGEEPELEYRGQHTMPPPRERISWLGGDTTSGHWIWREAPDEHALQRGTELRRRLRREHL